MVQLKHINEMILYYKCYMQLNKSYREIAEMYNTNPMKVKRRLEMIKEYDTDKYNQYRKKVLENGRGCKKN